MGTAPSLAAMTRRLHEFEERIRRVEARQEADARELDTRLAELTADVQDLIRRNKDQYLGWRIAGLAIALAGASGELAAARVPNLTLSAPSRERTFEEAAAAWQASRVDVAESTATTHRVNLRRILPILGEHAVDTIEPADVAALVARLHEGGLKRESIRKTVGTLAMVLDFAGRSGEHNPARDRLTVKLPREVREEPKPPTAEQVVAVHRILAPAYRLPLLVLDATGMRVGELEALTWGDVDEARGRWRVSQAVAKTGRARWVFRPGSAVLGCARAPAARRSDSRAPCVPWIQRRSTSQGDRASVHRRRCPRVLAA